ncbi:MAG: terpene synthase family protein [Mycobacteriales bacterium]
MSPLPLPPPPPDLTVPEPWCPLPVRLHPAREETAEWLTDWAYRRNLLHGEAATRRFTAARFALFAAYTCSGAEDLRLAAAWTAVNWLIDDELDGSGTDPARFARAALDRLPTGPLFVRPRPASPLLAALDELWEWTAPHRSASWRERFVAHYRDWLAHSVLQRDLRHLAHLDEPATYTRRRRMHSGVEMSLDLTEAAADHELPRVLAHAQPYLELRRLANDIISWHNDLYSVADELAVGDHRSLPAVLVGGGASWQEALDGTARAIAAATRDFLAACDDLREMAGYYPVTAHEVEYTLDMLTLWISGSLRWHQVSARYQQVEPRLRVT